MFNVFYRQGLQVGLTLEEIKKIIEKYWIYACKIRRNCCAASGSQWR